MVFNAVFNTVSVVSRWPVHLSMLSWNSFYQYTYSAQYSFQSTGTAVISSKVTQWKNVYIKKEGPQAALARTIVTPFSCLPFPPSFRYGFTPKPADHANDTDMPESFLGSVLFSWNPGYGVQPQVIPIYGIF